MGFSFGFKTNDANLTACALAPFKDILTFAQGAPFGWGLAYFQAGQPLLRKQPKTHPGILDFLTTTSNLKTDLLLGHIRGTNLGGQRTENTHPFRYRNWIFCHSGSLDRFEDVKEDMLRSVPDYIRRNIRGNTDSEHLFHLFLSFLNDTGKIDDPRIPVDVAAQALASTFAYVNRLITDRGGAPASGCCILSNGSILVATRKKTDLKVFRNASYSCMGADGKPIPSAHLKSVMMIGGTLPANLPGWEEVAENQIVTIDNQMNIKYSIPL